jgi:hypothetical protein
VTTYLCLVGTATLALLAFSLYRKEAWNKKVEAQFARQEERETQMWAVLEMVKVYYEGARIQRKEGQIAKDELGAKVDEKAEELAHKIEAVPGRVADALKAGDSGITRSPGGP